MTPPDAGQGAPDGVLRVGTRASALALTQTTQVADRLADLSGLAVEIVRVRTEGDRTPGPLAQMGGTGVFVTALREALLDDRCDIAVHSLKDLPTGPAEGIVLGAVPQRVDPSDVLCARGGWTVETLPTGARVGTGSPRRRAQLLAVRPDLDVVDIRGNVDTRLARIEQDLDAVVLARAGLERLGRLDAVTEVIALGTMLPAPGQGALAVECVDGRTPPALVAALRRLDHLPTRLAVTAERSLLATLEAGCSAPVGAWASIEGDPFPSTDDAGARTLHLHAIVAHPEGTRQFIRTGSAVVRAEEGLPGDGLEKDAEIAAGLGERVARQLLSDGAGSLTGREPGA